MLLSFFKQTNQSDNIIRYLLLSNTPSHIEKKGADTYGRKKHHITHPTTRRSNPKNHKLLRKALYCLTDSTPEYDYPQLAWYLAEECNDIVFNDFGETEPEMPGSFLMP